MEIKGFHLTLVVWTWTEFVGEMFLMGSSQSVSEDISLWTLFSLPWPLTYYTLYLPHHHSFCLVSTSGVEFRVLMLFCLALVISQLRNRTTKKILPARLCLALLTSMAYVVWSGEDDVFRALIDYLIDRESWTECLSSGSVTGSLIFSPCVFKLSRP